MYYFIAYYVDMHTNKKTSKAINFDGQFFENEKEIYMHAMAMAYDLKEDHELFDNLQFVAC